MSDIVERENAPPAASTPKPRLPDFATDEEIRDFWATHDFSDYFEQTEDVTNAPPADMKTGQGRGGSGARKRPPPGRMDLVSLRLPAEMIDAVKTIAAERHLPYQTLMRAWIAERLAEERNPGHR